MLIDCKNALIIFARKPVLGKVKTRLAASIGDIKALEIYKKLLEHTRDIARASNADVFIFLTETLENNFWAEFNCENQSGINLGERMLNAFKLLFNNSYNKVIIIGSDCPALTIQNVDTAFKELDNHDAVIGPALDGGYYLLGMKKLIPALFIAKEWSTDIVFEQTVNDLKSESLAYCVLGVLSDLDEVKDIPLLWL